MVKYFRIYHDLTTVVQELSDTEAGRLFKALLEYSSAGEARTLTGPERLVYAMVKAQIDRDRDSYDKKTQRNRENGAKGGRPPKPTGFLNNPEKPTGFLNNPEKPTKSQRQDKIRQDIIPLTPLQGDDDDDLLCTQQEHNQVLDAAGKAGFPTSDAMMSRLVDLYAEHGKEKLLAAIDCCVEHNAVNLAYLRAVLKDKPKAEEEPYDWMAELRSRGIGV